MRALPTRRLAAALLLAGVAGCGSTVQQTGTTVADGSGLTAPGGGTTGSTSGTVGSNPLTGTGGVGQPGSYGTGSTGGLASGSTGVATTGGSTGTTTGAHSPGAPGPVVGPGITPTTIYIGQNTADQSAAADRAIGAAGAAPSYKFGDVFQAVVDYANSHGGFAGRKLKALYFDYNLAEDQNVQDQSACDKWTHDNHVFAMPGTDDILRECAEKAGAVSLVSGNSTGQTYLRFPHFVDPTSIRLDRLGTVTVNGLVHAKYFSGKLGVITWDDPNYKYAYEHGYAAALAAHHIPIVDHAFVAVPQQVNALGDMSAAMRSIVTKFRSEGINHVIIADGHAGVWAGGGLTLEFMYQAKSQLYYPRYGQNAYNIPGSSELPSDQMDKAIAIMDTDSEPRFDAGWHQNQTRVACFKVEAKAGFPVQNDQDQDRAAQACDTVFFLQRIINGDHALTSNAFINGVAQLGRSWPSAYVYGTEFAPGLRDGSAKVRQATYFDSCKCLRYKGPPYYP